MLAQPSSSEHSGTFVHDSQTLLPTPALTSSSCHRGTTMLAALAATEAMVTRSTCCRQSMRSLAVSMSHWCVWRCQDCWSCRCSVADNCQCCHCYWRRSRQSPGSCLASWCWWISMAMDAGIVVEVHSCSFCCRDCCWSKSSHWMAMSCCWCPWLRLPVQIYWAVDAKRFNLLVRRHKNVLMMKRIYLYRFLSTALGMCLGRTGNFSFTLGGNLQRNGLRFLWTVP